MALALASANSRCLTVRAFLEPRRSTWHLRFSAEKTAAPLRFDRRRRGGRSFHVSADGLGHLPTRDSTNQGKRKLFGCLASSKEGRRLKASGMCPSLFRPPGKGVGNPAGKGNLSAHPLAHSHGDHDAATPGGKCECRAIRLRLHHGHLLSITARFL